MVALTETLKGNTKRIRVKKRTVSNLWRYEGRQKEAYKEVDLSAFDQSLYLDKQAQTLEVQGLTTYENIVNFTVPRGFLPTVTPELKHITIGGATVGIGIESNCHRYGFVHDGILEADVLLPDGSIVTCAPEGPHEELFYGLPNSYGTLGYVLRVKVQLYPIKPYVKMRTKHYTDVNSFITDLRSAAETNKADYLETLIYTEDDLHLTVGTLTNEPENLVSIYGKTIFYKEVSAHATLSLPIQEYVFRYDPELFWNIPETFWYKIFRNIAPASLRNSGLYTRYTFFTSRWLPFLRKKRDDMEKLIQDWEVPFEHATSFLRFALKHVNLDGKPWIATAIKTPAKATCYPMQKDTLYFNLGFYGFVKKSPGIAESFYATKTMDDWCFAHQGIKMLYSTTFISREKFDRIYNGIAHRALKEKYDPLHIVPDLYEKTVEAR